MLADRLVIFKRGAGHKRQPGALCDAVKGFGGKHCDVVASRAQLAPNGQKRKDIARRTKGCEDIVHRGSLIEA